MNPSLLRQQGLPLSEHFIDALLVTMRQVMPPSRCIRLQAQFNSSQELTFGEGDLASRCRCARSGKLLGALLRVCFDEQFSVVPAFVFPSDVTDARSIVR